jgi:ferredoxin-nitrate reductase
MGAIQYKSTCSYCGVGCGLIIKKSSQGRITVEGDPDHPASKGMLCSKGRNLHYAAEDRSDRLLYPEMRRSPYEPLTRVSWDDALDRITSVFSTFIRKYGPDSVGFYVSGQLLTEEYYIANKLTKGFLGTNNIDTNSRLCMSSAVVGYKLSLGEDAVPVSYADIELADCFFITGANPAWCHPILFRRIEAHKAANPDVKIIVADPRRTQSAAMADLHLALQPGTDVYLNYAITRVLIEEGFTDKAFIEKHTNGFEALKEKVFSTSLREYSRICDVPAEDIQKAARFIGESKGFITMWAMGLNQSIKGVDKNLSLINLSLITGKIGKPGSGPFSLTGQPNAMGGRETGGLCNILPAHRNLDNPEHRKFTEDFWGSTHIAEKPGYTATQMFDALAQDKLKAVWIICTNPLTSLPNARIAEEALKKARFVVVQDISSSTTCLPYADVVLPAAGWAEKEGTMTNSDRRISLLQKAIDAPGGARPDVEILCDFARRMGYKGFSYRNNAEIYAEYARMTADTNIDISGLSYEYLLRNGTTQWPFPKGSTTGRERLFTDHRFYTPDEKAVLHAPNPQNESTEPTEEYPLILTTGRIRDQWHTMTRTGKVNRLTQHISEPFLEIHPSDAARLGIKEDVLTEITSPYGNIRMKAKITPDIKPGVVFAPMHWGRRLSNDLARANNVTSPLVDARSKEPDFKFTAVKVEKYIKPMEKLVIVGAGAASYKLAAELRSHGCLDEIHIFSSEKHPFYNRVLLPDYINGTKSWEQLQKATDNEICEMYLSLHSELKITKIDKTRKVVIDAENKEHGYDRLILATGSRPTWPQHISANQPGVFTVRDRSDADRIMQTVNPGDTVVIAGAGLLGLEMAAAFCETGINTCIINRVSRLMNRQLDKVSGEILKETIEEQGTLIYSNDEIEIIKPTETGSLVVLKSGQRIACKVVVFGIGTTPNVELAREAGLTVQRGVVVDGYMQTSDPHIFAIGEIAQHNDTLYGITMVAEEQAEILARYLMGDVSAIFKGSVSMNILKYPGIDLCSLGLPEIPAGTNGYEEIVFLDRASRFYKKCIIYNDKLVGAILMGDKSEFTEFKDLIKNGTELSEKRLSLLRSGKPSKPLLGSVVCSCNNVGRGNIEAEIKAGITDLSLLCQATGAGTGCGSCKPEVKAILEATLITEPAYGA